MRGYPSRDLAAALREYLGGDAEGLADSVAASKAVKRMVKKAVAAYRRRNAAVVSSAVALADSALAEKESAARAAVQARKDAEQAEGLAVEEGFGDVS